MSNLSVLEIETIKKAAAEASGRSKPRLDLFWRINAAVKLYISERMDKTAFELTFADNSFQVSGYRVHVEFFLAGDHNICMKSNYTSGIHLFPIGTTTIPEVIAILEAALEG